MNTKVVFSIEKVELIEEVSDFQLSKVRMWIAREGQNSHKLPIARNAISLSKKSLVGKPILCKYNKYTDNFEGHEIDEIPVGCFIRDSEIYEEEIDGKLWVVADGYIWKKYFPEVIRVFQKDENNTSKISMEIEVLEYGDNEYGSDGINLFAFLGVTLIGVEPAIAEAKATILRFSEMIEETKNIISNKPQKSKLNKDFEKYFKHPIDESKKEGEKMEENKENLQEKMASDSYIESSAQEELNKKEDENNKELTDDNKEEMADEEGKDKEEDKNEDSDSEQKEDEKKEEMSEEESVNYQQMYEEMCGKYEDMCNKYSAMEEKMSTYMAENEDLKKFKADMEEKEKMQKVEYALSEVMECMSKEKIEELREDSKTFSLDDISAWENKVKAEAFSATKGKLNSEGFTRIALPFANNEIKQNSKSIWDRI